jgi:hypothetical protein
MNKSINFVYKEAVDHDLHLGKCVELMYCREDTDVCPYVQHEVRRRHDVILMLASVCRPTSRSAVDGRAATPFLAPPARRRLLCRTNFRSSYDLSPFAQTRPPATKQANKPNSSLNIHQSWPAPPRKSRNTRRI